MKVCFIFFPFFSGRKKIDSTSASLSLFSMKLCIIFPLFSVRKKLILCLSISLSSFLLNEIMFHFFPFFSGKKKIDFMSLSLALSLSLSTYEGPEKIRKLESVNNVLTY